ncbi:MAG: response regulator transcription factor [Bacteroidales bacterium]|nr:response regulator transcription factor [Bacteroidales bacterium]
MEANKQKIFLVEDDINFGAVMKSYLEMNDYSVVWIKDGKDAIMAFRSDNFDLCILDVMLPHVDGFTIAGKIKEIDDEIPIIFLTAKTLKSDILEGFKKGADDYITKPFDSDVLILKIRAILKRNSKSKEDIEFEEFNLGKYVFNYRHRFISFQGNSQKLSPKEAELLKMLCLKLNEVLDRQEALKKIWKEDSYFTTRSMDVYITKLRKYLKEDPRIELNNIHGAGFVLSVGE